MRCVRLSWRINHDFTLRQSAWPEKKQRETDRQRDREREKENGCLKDRERRGEKREREGTDKYGPAANRSIPLIAQLAHADDMNAI